MNKYSVKNISAALIITVTGLVSTNVSAAEETNIEAVISQFIVEQSQQVIAELNTQIEQSISNSMKSITEALTIEQTFAWLADEQQINEVKLVSKEPVEKALVKASVITSTSQVED